jgi:serine/threonine protein kinase
VIPENVILTDDGAVVADTGVRGAVCRCLRAGFLPDSNAQDDMWAVGALVYEMLTGRPRLLELEKFEETRALPAWVPDLMSHRWADAGEALAAIRL